MKSTLQYMLRLKHEYARLPFFGHLRNQRLSAVERLAFFPCMAPFVQAFSDLNRHVFREESTIDPYQKLVNARTCGYDHEWPMYLEDFAKLGHDLEVLTPTEAMRHLWNDETISSRLLPHRLSQLICGAEPVVRLAVLEAIEDTRDVMFALTAELARAVQRDSGTELRYCGRFLSQLDSGHDATIDYPELARIVLDLDQRTDAVRRVAKVFELFTEWTHELLRFAQARQQTPAPGDEPVFQLHGLAHQLLL